MIKTVRIKDILNLSTEELQAWTTAPVTINGWIRSMRISKKICFIDLVDGSSLASLQVLCFNDDETLWTRIQSLKTRAIVTVSGSLQLVKEKKQNVELVLKQLVILNTPLEQSPLQKKQHSLEFLREQAHLRPLTKTFYAVFKIRSKAALAIHEFFQNEDFIYVNTPIITANDAEGAGENFTVTTIENNLYETDFFQKKASLTVSGQLNGEAFAQAFGRIYTFGPTFRAENSHTSRHVAEFWMIEPEFIFATLEDNMLLAEKLVKYVTAFVIKTCHEELLHLEEQNNISVLASLQDMADETKPFAHMSYDDAIVALQAAQANGHSFVYNEITWGMNLQSEHERYLCEEVTNYPLFITNYPKAIKAFYMKQNTITDANRQTVQAMDLLVPHIGELIGGSVREDDFTILTANKDAQVVELKNLDWYLNLRKFGYAPSAGFGLGFERLIMLLTGMNNIRDVIPFARTPNNLEF